MIFIPIYISSLIYTIDGFLDISARKLKWNLIFFFKFTERILYKLCHFLPQQWKKVQNIDKTYYLVLTSKNQKQKKIIQNRKKLEKILIGWSRWSNV